MLICDNCKREITNEERKQLFTRVVRYEGTATYPYTVPSDAEYGDVCSVECMEAWMKPKGFTVPA